MTRITTPGAINRDRWFVGMIVGLLIATAALPASAEGFADHDTKKPIDISADELTVAQRDQQATFTGNVQAVQGDMTLRADKLRVLYGGEAAGAIAGAQSIRRIEVDGHVVITSPEETAEGNAGYYDVVSAEIVLEGDVALTQGQNVIRGDRLRIDLKKGTATVSSAKTATGGGRVRALFIPADGGVAGGADPQ